MCCGVLCEVSSVSGCQCGETPLLVACKYGHGAVVGLLCDAGALLDAQDDVSAGDSPTLAHTARVGHMRPELNSRIEGATIDQLSFLSNPWLIDCSCKPFWTLFLKRDIKRRHTELVRCPSMY